MSVAAKVFINIGPGNGLRMDKKLQTSTIWDEIAYPVPNFGNALVISSHTL